MSNTNNITKTRTFKIMARTDADVATIKTAQAGGFKFRRNEAVSNGTLVKLVGAFYELATPARFHKMQMSLLGA